MQRVSVMGPVKSVCADNERSWQALSCHLTQVSRCCHKQQHFTSAGSVCAQSLRLSELRQKVTGVLLIMPHHVSVRLSLYLCLYVCMYVCLYVCIVEEVNGADKHWR